MLPPPERIETARRIAVIMAERRGFVTKSDILASVAMAFCISRRDIIAGGRHWPYRRARWAAIALYRERHISLSEIGRRLGGLHHTTVMHALRRMANG